MTSYDDRGSSAGGADPMDPAAAPLEAPVLAALRDLYAPPGGEEYWDGLESRVMSRVLGRTTTEWWQVMSEWSRAAAMAAAVAIIVATALLVTAEQRTPEMDIAAYDAVAFEAEEDEALAFSFDAEAAPDEVPVNERALPSVLPH